jgi:phosphoglycerate dehydrogenase-like enzyme
LDDYEGAATALADWTAVGDRVTVRTVRETVADEARLADLLAGEEIVVVMRERTSFPASLFERLPRLRLLVTTGFRNAGIDLAAAGGHGVTVCGTASGSRPPAELTWALILALARNLVPESVALRSGAPRPATIGTDLAGATLGLVGLGRIGTDVARVGLAFGMRVQAWSPNLTPERAAAHGVRCCRSMHELFESSDFASIHLVLSDRTRGLVDATALRAMRPTAYLINTARAAIVDEVALLDVLARGGIAGAGLDVFHEEPLPDAHPFRTLPNVLATPHLGYVTRRNYTDYFTQVVEDIDAYLHGAPIRVLADAESWRPDGRGRDVTTSDGRGLSSPDHFDIAACSAANRR